jgi:hypothetical protein
MSIRFGMMFAKSSEIAIWMVLKDHPPARDVAFGDPSFPEELHYAIVGRQLRDSLFSDKPLQQTVWHLLSTGGNWNFDQDDLLRCVIFHACEAGQE